MIKKKQDTDIRFIPSIMLHAFTKSKIHKIVKAAAKFPKIKGFSKKENFKLSIIKLLSILIKKNNKKKEKINFILYERLYLSSSKPIIKKRKNVKMNAKY